MKKITILLFLLTITSSFADLQKGQVLFKTYCATCHAPNGAGLVAPNLTDSDIIHGSDKESIVRVITNGVIDKGMPTWGNVLKAEEISDLADHIKSIMGKNLAKPSQARYAIYYPIHFIGIFLLFMCIGATCIHVSNGGTKADNKSRKLLGICHGVALLMVIVGGMGLIKATFAVSNGFPAWIIIKLAIWLILGASSLIIYKQPKYSTAFFFIFSLLGIIAALAAKFKFLSVYTGYFN
jgi:cytochrome c553